MSGVLLKLAMRNLWRQRRRTLLTCLALAVGIYMFILMDSLLAGFDEMGSRNLINLETGHLQIMSSELFDDKRSLSLDHVFPVVPALALTEQVGEISQATARLQFPARVNNGWEEYAVIATGIDVSTDPMVFPLPDYVAGKWLEPGTNQILLGKKVAELMELAIGDYVTVLARTATGAFQALDFEVVGTITSPHPMIDQNMVFLPLETAQAGFGVEGMVTNIAMRVADGQLEQAYTSLQSLVNAADLGDSQVYTWRQSAADFLAIGESKQITNYVLLGLVVLIAVVGVINTILLGAMERTREIGMMKAMGMREKEVVQEFILESFGLGTVGALLGCLLGIATNWYFVNVGIDFSGAYGDIDIGYPVQGMVYGVWNWNLILVAFIAGVIVSAIAGIVPAMRAAGKDPIWALRQ